MPYLPPPSTLIRWAKVLYWLATTVQVGVEILKYDFNAPMGHVGMDTADPLANTWRRFSIRFADTVSQDTADDQYMTFDVLNITNGAVDGTWNDDDYNIVVGQLDTMLLSLTQYWASRYKADQCSAYVMAFNPYTDRHPFAKSGAPDRIYPLNHLGGGSAAVPAQACSSVTEETPSRAHWGRFYLPTLGGNCYSSEGRLITTVVDGLAGAVHTAYDNMMQGQLFPVVATTSAGQSKPTIENPGGTPASPVRSLQTVTGIRVDDVPDVIRRRRLKHATYKKIYATPAATSLPAPSA